MQKKAQLRAYYVVAITVVGKGGLTICGSDTWAIFVVVANNE